MNNIYSFEPNKYPLSNGMRLIEASAGTGKTFSLAHLVLRLITEKEYLINEILVVSFTEATASEIKSKIIERLILALKTIESISGNGKSYEIDNVLKEWVKINVNSKERGLYISALLLEALERIDTADITTIHGFCSKTLKREAIENGYSLNPKIEKNSHSIINEIIEEYWKKQILGIDIPDLKGIFKSNFNRKNLTHILNILESDANSSFRNTLNEVKIDADLPEQLNNYLESLWIDFLCQWKENGEKIETYFIKIAKVLKSKGFSDIKPYSSNPKKDRYKVLNNWIEEYKGIKTPSYDEIQRQTLLNNYYHPKNIYNLIEKYNADFTLDELKPLFNSIVNLINSPAEFVWEHALLWTMRELEKRKAKNSIISYSDLLKSLDPINLKNNKEIEENINYNIYVNLKKRYKAVLVDEFQDTDPVQLRLLEEAFGTKDRHLLLMIGDPKQAIYSFRGGSLNTYMKARRNCERIDLLDTNYRSTKSLILKLNKLFMNGLIRSNLSVEQLKPCSQENELNIKGMRETVKILNLLEDRYQEEGIFSKLDSKSKVEEKIPKVIGSYLIDLLNNNPQEINPSDICILVNKHDQAKSIHRYLSKVRIPSKLHSNESIFNEEGAQILQIFINCIDTPFDQQKLALLACSELLQWKKEQLTDSKLNGNFDSLSSKFHDLAKLFPKIGLLGCLSKFLEGELIADLSQRGSLLSDLYQTSQLVDEQIHLQEFNIRRASQWLRCQRLKNIEPIPDEHQPNSDVSDSSVNIITIHKSKGLQFKIVICPYLWQKPPENKNLLWKDNQKLLISKKYVWYKNYNSYLRASKEESLKEAERLAYVALTRAKKQLIILWAKAKGQEGNPLSGFLFGPDSIKLKIDDHTKEMMEVSLRERELKVDIEDIKLVSSNNIWYQPKSKLKLSLGLIPSHQLDKSWGRYSFSSWINQKGNESKRNHLTEKIHEDLSFKYEANENQLDSPDPEFIREDPTNTHLKENLWFKESPISSFPRGPIAGTCLHKILERVDLNNLENQLEVTSIIEEELSKVNITNSFIDPIYILLRRIANIPLGGPLGQFKLKKLRSKSFIKELVFDIPICHNSTPINTLELSSIFRKDTKNRYSAKYADRLLNLNIHSSGFLTGSIDLVFADKSNHKEAKWWVLDWKSNWIDSPLEKKDIHNCGPSNYSVNRMDQEMYHHHYPLQAHIYLLALHRFLNWRLPNYSLEKHLGGYIYLFLRGIPDNKDIEINNYRKRIPGLIIESAPIERIKELDSLIKRVSK
tara:strand:+ start:7000 stop:10785 length:3786 start_codon:yes stop_codon:yes gene_type:complete